MSATALSVCGFYYALSEASLPHSFLNDEQRCRSSCSSPTKLFYSLNPDDDSEQMVALTGERYGELPNAFRYRTEYVDACTCKPKPWSAEARRHRAASSCSAIARPVRLAVPA
jgi:Protein of unknown function (DUF2865)